MSEPTKHKIFTAAKRLFSIHGYEGLGMRTLAKEAGVALSVIYHHYTDKDQLLTEIFNYTRKNLGELRAQLPARDTAADMLYDRIVFQIDHIEDVVFILKYYIHYRTQFDRNDRGYIPVKAYLHIEEVLEHGLETGEFQLRHSVPEEAKIITHAINGFLLEYYPVEVSASEKRELASSIHDFVLRAISGGVMAQGSEPDRA
jgi:AcrR family transcriptional regulator